MVLFFGFYFLTFNDSNIVNLHIVLYYFFRVSFVHVKIKIFLSEETCKILT